jgi:BASS family bile acid:Na+ symporter
MYGIALDLRWSDFRFLIQHPKSFILGVLAQFVVLPFLTWVLVIGLQPPSSIALGMFLVAACPGGNVSNFLTNFAKGNTALSVSLTAFSSVSAIVLTPLNFTVWAGLYPPTSHLLKEISLDIQNVFFTVGIILGIPLILGIFTYQRFPDFAAKLSKLLKPLSMLIFAAFIILAFSGNYSLFIQHIQVIFFWVLLHNFVALAAGFVTAKAGNSTKKEIKTITIETGIQNSGLGLVLIFTYFEGLGGMAILTAWWGIWHLISGMILAAIWRKFD